MHKRILFLALAFLVGMAAHVPAYAQQTADTALPASPSVAAAGGGSIVNVPAPVKKLKGAELILQYLEPNATLREAMYVGSTFKDSPVEGRFDMRGSLLFVIYKLPANMYNSNDVVDAYASLLKNDGFAPAGKTVLYHGKACDQLQVCPRVYNEKIKSKAENLFYKKQSDGSNILYAVVARTYDEIVPYATRKLEHGPVKQTTFQPGETMVLLMVNWPKKTDMTMFDEDFSWIEQSLKSTGKADLYGIYFDFNKANVKPESAPTLAAIADILKRNPEMKLQVIGHTDNVGTPEYNQKLSQARAYAAATELVAKYGVTKSRLAPSGKGATQPVAANTTDEGRAKNRRVELKKF